MDRNPFVLLATLLFLAGCASPPRRGLSREGISFPAEALITQRAVLTVRGRQFTLNGYLARSKVGGMRLIVTENFGNVLADVLVEHDGTTRVIRSSRMLRPAWIREFVAADLKCIYGDAPEADCPGRTLSPTHFIIERRWYTLDLRIVGVESGLQPAEMFEAPPGKSL